MGVAGLDLKEVFARLKPLIVDEVLMGRERTNLFNIADVLRQGLRTAFQGLCYNQMLKGRGVKQ